MAVADVLRALAATIGDVDPDALAAVGGGSINRSYELSGDDGARYFLKLNHASLAEMFDAERDGLLELENARAVRVPRAVASGTAGDSAYLLLECLDLCGRSAAAATALGERLVRQHRVVRGEFGWHRDNTIGSTPQINTRRADWIGFLREERLGYQLELASLNGLPRQVAARGTELLARLPEFFDGYEPAASLLHGDLWGGNWGALRDGEPVIFDPAVYYGDREADIAMTMLFGGFDSGFYAAYEAAWPLDAGFRRRADLYNLYHVLNHYNLFGGGYQSQAAAMLDRLLA
jgi:fructosamine-3-kinase